MKRRRYLAISTSIGAVSISGCSSIGGPTYSANASEYLLPFEEVNRILLGNASGREVEYKEDAEVDSGRSYRFQAGSLAEFGLLVFKSIDDAETAYEDLVWQVNNTGATRGQQVDLGSEGIYDEVAGSRLLGVRLDNVTIQLNGRTSPRVMQRLAAAQIDRIQRIG